MINKDYILRMAERFGRYLDIIIGLRQSNKHEEALIYIDDLFLQTTGLTTGFINSASEDMLLNLLSPLRVLNVEKCLWMAMLLKEEANIYENMGQPTESYYRYLKSLFLFIEVSQRDSAVQELDIDAAISDILNKLAEYELPFKTQERLFRYYEKTGKYAKAEDVLFEMVEAEIEASGNKEAIIQQGMAFYGQLMKKSAAALQAGNLSREEVEEGLAQLQAMMTLSSQLYCNTCGAANQDQTEHCFACEAPLHAPSREPLLKERYRVLVPVGQGGFGAVYKVEDTWSGNRLLAMKEINLSVLTTQEALEATNAFNREVSLLSNLTHPNLPRIYDHFTDREHWYLVMDFIEGETLEQYLDRKLNGCLPLAEVLAIGIQLCTVLNYLHTREPAIIFRDLKPANVMRTPSGHLYLIDFGIARHFKPGQTADTIALGSPGYAAREQYSKAQTQTTPRSDIYSLGATLHQLLTG